MHEIKNNHETIIIITNNTLDKSKVFIRFKQQRDKSKE